MQPAIANPVQGIPRVATPPVENGVVAELGGKAKPRSAEFSNPYLAARSAWDERYGDLIARARHWRMAAFLSGAVALLAVAGLILTARQSKLVPFVVAVNELGRPLASGVARASGGVDDRVMKAALADFVTQWRGVTIDWTFQRSQIDRVFAQIGQGSRAQVSISEWYRADPPQNRAQKGTTEIEIKAVLATGEKTWEVDWTEINRLATGQQQGKENYKGLFTVAVNPPQAEEDGRANPLGIFIINATWSRVF
jgi:type IV secretion system protein VirB5